MPLAEGDERLEFIIGATVSSFGTDRAKFTKAFLTEDNLARVEAFFEEESKMCIVLPPSCKVEEGFPSKLSNKGKSVIFLKQKAAPVSAKFPVAQQLLTMEVSGSSPFEHLELVASEVFLPVLSNPGNQLKWGEVAAREILDRFVAFLSSTTILCGHVKGETRLPMPPDEQADANVKNRISLLEGAVITWTKQIKSVLKQDPESQLKLGRDPTPDVEIEFWKSKANNLNSIFDQLQSQRIRRVLRALDLAKSTYCTTFARLCKEVYTARLESNDNMKYLRTLEYWFGRLNAEDDFPGLQELFKPMLHIILLIWKNSKHYNTPARLVVLMREICNSLINQACKYVSGEQIFALIEADEANVAVEQLKTTLQVCGAFKSTYKEYRKTADAECPGNQWRIQNNAVFMRLDSFLERCHDILDLTQTIVQFSKLAKIEVGGTKGKTLTASVQQIHFDFMSAVELFKAVPYDIMDVGAKQFDDDFYGFRCAIKELERRLGAVVSLAFDDSNTVYGRFKLFDSFDGLLERPIIQDELEKKYVSLVQSYGCDLKRVQELFLYYRDAPPIASNLPPVSGALKWCRGLLDRIRIAMEKLVALDASILEREESREVLKVYSTMKSSLEEYENQKIEEWGRDVEASSSSKLRLPLLLRQADCSLTVNFDAALVRLLREVKYFLLMGLSVPDSALAIYEQVETFRAWTGQLDLIVHKYNVDLMRLLPVEKPLLQPYLDRFDKAVEAGLSLLNWETGGSESEIEKRRDFIAEATEAVHVVDDITCTMKTNLEKVNCIMDSWTEKPLMERKPKPQELDYFERLFKVGRAARYAEIKEGGKEIERMLKETNKILRVSNASLNWRAYMDFINNIVVDGLASVITCSLEYFLMQIDPVVIAQSHGNQLPMLEIKLDLIDKEPTFDPVIGSHHGKGMRDVSAAWVGSFFHVATLFKRLDTDGTYVREMHTDADVCLLMAEIEETQSGNELMLGDLKEQFNELSFLWKRDREASFLQFTQEAVLKTGEGSYLDLNKYDAAISKYLDVADRIKKTKSLCDVGWLRVNTAPIKSSLLELAEMWRDLHAEHLRNHLIQTLDRFDAFLEQVKVGLALAVDDGDEGQKNLRNVMSDILEVGRAENVTKEMFQPLRELCALLKHHQVDITAEVVPSATEARRRKQDPLLPSVKTVLDYLEEAPVNWAAVVKVKYAKKDEIALYKQKAEFSLKAELDFFYSEMRDFRGDFRAKAPFTHQGLSEEAYALIDKYAAELEAFERRAAEMNRQEELFELSVSKYPELPQTLSELRLLRNLWDFKAMVQYSYSGWKKSKWSAVDTDKLEVENKALLKALRASGAADPVVKGWVVFRDIEAAIRNMSIVLPLIADLHSDALAPRHWSQLARVCKASVVDPTQPEFLLQDMMKFNLHEYVEEVQEVVETAQKEKKIEKKLEDISASWGGFMLEYVKHKDTEMSLIRLNEEIIESLDAHMLELQTMLGMGKFVEFFRPKVEKWQATLSDVQEVIKLWESVSRSWASLESIFLTSADIRSQLADVTKVFESIDGEFKEMMREAVNEPNVVQACTVDGRELNLTRWKAGLDQCQKSLNEYLDRKKEMFPRFYFVSAVALLDMLANGTNPKKIMPYLGDCYDALANLSFVKDNEGNESNKTADVMIAKDREQIRMHSPFTMEGEVEVYLNKLTAAMMHTLRHQLLRGIEDGVNWDVDPNLPRHKWLFKYPAQVVLTGSLIYWTEETEQSLEELEGGKEDAVKLVSANVKDRLTKLILLVLGKLTHDERTKTITLITMDVHGRDVLGTLIDTKTEGPSAFIWQQQLRFYWEQDALDVNIKICDFRTKYFYEWTGNVGRLVITALTDRCYITLTMGLRLFLGGAPAGPAGTGKTETTKDLARALALPCYVFNCSDQMNYQSMADIFRGLAQTGAWGCFDEFNRISIEVLSVVATQVKTVQDAIVKFAVASRRSAEYQHLPAGTPPCKVGKFDFFGGLIDLIPTVGFYITMNPGYAGRSALPDNLEALFRPVAMMVPDYALIGEIMLFSFGYMDGRKCAKKMVATFRLCSEQLSSQDHYDYGMRAVKTVITAAGNLKQAAPDEKEEALLLRALQDVNIPKFLAHDLPLFDGILSDLFPGIQRPPFDYGPLMSSLKHAVVRQNLQTVPIFMRKNIELYEMICVRHGLMVVGPTGGGKTLVLDTLRNARLAAEDVVVKYWVINPKAQPTNELYGVMDPVTRDWTDGVLSKIFRELNEPLPKGKENEMRWIIYDGDVDAVWVENMNSVMDDNKLLTLPNGERIRLQPHCCMICETFDLQYASPATISRCGMVWVDPKNLGYRPYYERWVKKRGGSEEDQQLMITYFDQYVPKCADFVQLGLVDGELGEKLKCVIGITAIDMVKQLCSTLDAFLQPLVEAAAAANVDVERDDVEQVYTYCIIWSIGASLLGASRERFHAFVRKLNLSGLPADGLLTDYVFDIATKRWEKWSSRVPEYTEPSPFNFYEVIVPTPDSCSYTHLLQNLAPRKPILFVGESGTAKTTIVNDYLGQLADETSTRLTLGFSSRTSSKDVQTNLEANVDKRTGSVYGPPVGKKLAVFIDDLNMPKVDLYGTQQPITLLLTLISRGFIFDREKDLSQKTLKDLTYIGAMGPPGGGRNKVDPRFVALFSVFNLPDPSAEVLTLIYSSIISTRLRDFPQDVRDAAAKFPSCMLQLFNFVIEALPPTPSKFHYIFNLRDLSRVSEGVCLATPDAISSVSAVVRLYRNETHRIFCDRLVSEQDLALVSGKMADLIGGNFSDVRDEALKDPCIFGDYRHAVRRLAEGAEDARVYEDMGTLEETRKIFNGVMENFNLEHKPMTLVLFEQALAHLTRIHRIIRLERGNVLLVGVGGSGKQSLTRLAAFCAGYTVFSISLVRNYGETEFREDLKRLYTELGESEVVFLFTDAHVAEEGFLEFINNMLTTGMVPALYEQDERDALCNSVRREVKEKGMVDTPDNLWKYYVSKCQNNLHIALAMSPSGDKLRLRCRSFPGLISNAVIDWFFAWPEDALTKVANFFLADVPLPAEQRESVVAHLVYSHMHVVGEATRFAAQLRRFYYVTPKNYLDYISNYSVCLSSNEKKVDNSVKRLSGGLSKLVEAAKDVDRMSIELTEAKVIVDTKTVDVEGLIRQIQSKTVTANAQKAEAEVKQKNAEEQTVLITEEKAKAADALNEALPALAAAEAALANLHKDDITEIKNFAKPPTPVMNVCLMVVCLRPTNEKLDETWADAKKMLSNPKLLQMLKLYPKDAISEKMMKAARKYLKDPSMTIEKMATISKAGNGLLTWVLAISKYYDVAKNVEPLRNKVRDMEKNQAKTEKELGELNAELEDLERELGEFNVQYTEKKGELTSLQTQAALMEKRLSAASKLISGLAGERTRWTNDISSLVQNKVQLVGDCLLAASFLSYAGAFTHDFRTAMIYGAFAAKVAANKIPVTNAFSLEALLTTDAIVQGWTAKGLPADEHSVQNGILTTAASRFPLCIDPQQQAVGWIKSMYGKDQLKVKTLSEADFMKHLELAIQFGSPFLFENVDEDLDPMLDPVLEKNTYLESGQRLIKLGDKSVQWDDGFRLFLTTKLANPHYSPEIMSKTMIINYSVTQDGLANQLLNVVVAHERPDLELQYADLVSAMADSATLIVQLEDTLLRELSSSSGNILDNEELISTLDETKTKAEEIKAKLEQSKFTKDEISKARSAYQPVAKRGSVVYFVMASLSAINAMYETSLDSFLGVFHTALDRAKRDVVLESRLKNMAECIMKEVYNYTCTGIFERHKLMFAFQMTCRVQDGDGALVRSELDFFLKGDTALEAPKRASPAPWLSASGWKDLLALSETDAVFDALRKDFEAHQATIWKEWYDLETPEAVPLPGGRGETLKPLQRLCVMRCFRPDRVYNAVKLYVVESIGEKYVQPPVLDYARILAQSSERAPMVFILSPGADPQADIQLLCDERGFSSKFRFISLGQGQGPKAEELIEQGTAKGHWVLLQNCHLLVSWLKKLEKRLELMKAPHKDFRLWLTTEPTDRFPLGILQRSLKVVTEPPDGLKLNMRATYAKVDQAVYDECPHPAFATCLFVLAWLHAVVQERRKYGKIGWNVCYDFNESDFQISRKLLSLYLKKAFDGGDEKLPWGSLKYLIGDAMYGGRVSDDMDRRVLTTYLAEYMGDFLFDCQTFYFSRSGADYALVNGDAPQDAVAHIEALPLTNSPAVFGLHPNAEIGFYTNATKAMWRDLISLQPRGAAAAAGLSRDDVIGAVAADIRGKVPISSLDIGTYDLMVVRAALFDRNGEAVPTPCQVVLLQELERWNLLAIRMALSLADLQRAFKGEIGMSDELDALGASLYDGFIPGGWRKLAPDTEKPLGSWMAHYLTRHRQYEAWINDGEPQCIWLAGLGIPESYLTALVQTTCRACNWPLDKSTQQTSVTQFRSAEDISEPLTAGCYVSGLYLEGAAWDFEGCRLARQAPKVLVVELPILRVVPVEASRATTHGVFNTPVYVNQGRRNAMGVGLVFEAALATAEHLSHWVLQGVALALNTDT
mmetsp:Transcript_25191/g.84661  ORF Transcript_25191/g.84661 Transcript_25191/m.84661 type:complete len:4540 (+) Transcript_25191:178-13797(+)